LFFIFAEKPNKETVMSTIEMEAQKAFLAREILHIDDTETIYNMELLLKNYHQTVTEHGTGAKREIGFLEGKASVIFHDEWSMTPEELGML
jgi:hypothetical protein